MSLEPLAKRLEPQATWDDLAIPGETLGVLRQLADQVRHRLQTARDPRRRRDTNREKGTVAVFAGEYGAGKRLAAEVLATDLGTDIYRVDLCAVVSKYIGETEENVRRLFDVAERADTLLFFDEADALFDRRSEVKDSRDRYTTLELSYLLQRMEAFRGLSVLATNLRIVLELACTRPRSLVVNFPCTGPPIPRSGPSLPRRNSANS